MNNVTPTKIRKNGNVKVVDKVPGYRDKVTKVNSYEAGVLPDRRETEIKEYKLDERYLENFRTVRANNALIDGKNFCDESIHGTRDFGGTKYGCYITDDFISWGNDSNFLAFQTFKDRWLNNPKSGTGEKSSMWGVGTSKKTSYADGAPDFQLVHDVINNKYYQRVWDYEIQIPDNEFTRKSFNMLSDGSVKIIQYEITEQEYINLVPDVYEFKPTFYFQIRRFTNSVKNYEPNELIFSIEITLMFNSGRLFENPNNVWVKVNNGEKFYAVQKYLPGLSKDLKEPIKRITQISKYKTDNLMDSTIDIHILKRLTSKDIDRTGYEEWSRKVPNINKLAISRLTRGTRPLVIITDGQDTIMPRYEGWRGLSKLTPHREIIQNCIMVCRVRELGDLEFEEVKSSKPGDDIVNWSWKTFGEIVSQNDELKYFSGKTEDARVDLLKEKLINNEPEAGNMINSFGFLTDNKLTRGDLVDDMNHSIRPNLLKRNWDWLIKNKDGNQILHCEWWSGPEDIEHCDQFFRKVGKDICPYHVFVVGNFNSNAGKKNDLITDLQDRPSKHAKKIWLIQDKDFMDGNINGFKLLWEIK